MACTTNPPPGDSDAGTDAGAGAVDANQHDANDLDAWVPPVPTTTITAGNAVGPTDPLWDGQQRFLYDT